MKKRIILISGFARSGKDTLAQALGREFGAIGRNPRTVKFANALKASLQTALQAVGLGHIDAFTEDEEQKKLLRPLLVEFGKYCRAKDKDVFVKATIADIEALFDNGFDVALISDCRYLNEATLLRDWALNNGHYARRMHIDRYAVEAANEEERLSIAELNLNDYAVQRDFNEGDVEGINQWAKEQVGTMHRLDRMKEDYFEPYTVSVTEVLKQLDKAHGTDHADTFAKHNAETKAWIGEHDPEFMKRDGDCKQAIEPCQESWSENWERRLKEVEGLVVRVNTNRDNIDHLIRRVEKLEGRADGGHKALMEDYDRLEALERSNRDLSNAVLGLTMRIERMDAHIKALEVRRG